MKQYCMQDQDLTIVTETIDQGEVHGRDQVGLIRDHENQLISLSLKVNGEIPFRQQIEEEGPPFFKTTSSYRWMESQGILHGQWLEVTVSRSRWLQDGIWFEQMKILNPQSDQTSILIEFDVSGMERTKNVNRLTVLWTDQMVRFQQLNADWSFSELWIEWDRHAEVFDNGKRISFRIPLSSLREESLSLRIFPLTKKTRNAQTLLHENVSGLLQTYEQYVNRTFRFSSAVAEMERSFQKTVRSIRSSMVERNGQLLPYAVLNARTPEAWIHVFRSMTNQLSFDASAVVPVILLSAQSDAFADAPKKEMFDFRIERLFFTGAWFDWTADVNSIQQLLPVLQADCEVLVQSLLSSTEKRSVFYNKNDQKHVFVSRIPHRTNRVTQALIRYASVLIRCGLFDVAEKILNMPQMSHVRFAEIPETNDGFSTVLPTDWSAGEWGQYIGVRPDGITGTFRIVPQGKLREITFGIRKLRLGSGTIGFDWLPSTARDGEGMVILTENSSGYRFAIPVPERNPQDLQLI